MRSSRSVDPCGGGADVPDDPVWYFAYGSNLDRDQKEARTGAIREARVARLRGYRLAFNKRASKAGRLYANIVPDPDGPGLRE